MTAFSACGCFACMPLPSSGGFIDVAGESAIIVWNSSTQTEHFIRSVTFNASGTDFGFVVPTPSVPHITAADPAAFQYIKEHILPGYVPDVPYTLPPPGTRGEITGGLARVEVMAQESVDGTDVTTVSASDTDGLKAWMTANGFTWTDDMASWLDPYIQKNWVITLFKYQKKDSSLGSVSSSLLDMTFQTTVPFFPYSEPASQRVSGNFAPRRALNVYLFSDSRMYGGMEVNPDKVQWPAQLLYADRVAPSKLNALLPLLHLRAWDFPASPWLTVLRDTKTPRPGVADVVFVASDRQVPVVVSDLQDRVANPWD